MATINQIGLGLSGASGTGNFAGNVSPQFTTPALGTPTSGLLSSCTGLPLTTGVTGILGASNGGTGINNGSSTITLGGSLTTSGAFASTFTMTGATNVTFPVSGTLATTGGSVVSLQGTANQVLVNGTSGSPVTGTAITLTTPQNIGTTSTPIFGGLTAINGIANFFNSIRVGSAATPSGDPSLYLFSPTANLGSFGLTAVNNAGAFNNSLTHASTAANRTWTLPDATGTVLITGTAINSVPSITFSSTSGIIGTTTNNDASAGSVGELISSTIASGSAVSLSTGTAANVTSISLTAGDWQVWGNVTFVVSGGVTNATYQRAWTSLTSATAPDASLMTATSNNAGVTFAVNPGIMTPTLRVSISGTTTVYLSAQSAFSASTTSVCGGIYARRLR